MANEYYERLSEMNPGDLADGLAMEAEFDAIAQGFSKLPTPHTGGQGFDGPVRIGDAVNTDEAVSLGQLNAAIGEAVLLDIAIFGNLNAAAWGTKASGDYLLFGTGAKFSNFPATLVPAATYFVHVRHAIGGAGVSLYSDKLTFASVDNASNLDINREFSRLGSTLAAANTAGWKSAALKKGGVTPLEALTPVADKLPFYTGEAAASLTDLTLFARGLLGGASALEMREVLGVSAYATRNVVINGDFNIAQLGTSMAAQFNGAFITDMWRLYWTGAGLPTTRGVSVAGVPAPYGLRSWLDILGASGNTGAELETRVESRDSARLCQRPCVASAYIFNNTGADREFTLFVSTPDTSENWGTSTNKLAVNLTMPNGQWGRISGKFTADGSFANGVSVRINTGGGIAPGRNVFISGVQLEPGTVLTEFEACPVGLALLLCQRYYESTQFRLDVTGSGVSNFSSLFMKLIPKRTVPTLSRTNESVTACLFNSFAQASTVGATIIYTPTTSGAGVVSASLIADARL
ncbi:hypothetical protein [Aeromonas hydrophila]